MRLEAVYTTIKSIDSVLNLLVDHHTNEARLQNLNAIIRKAATFGRSLIFQPSWYQLNWTSIPGAGGLIIFPGLAELSDDGGQPLPKATWQVYAETSRLILIREM